MKYASIMAVMLSANMAVHAQSLQQTVINNAGGSYQNAGLTFEWSIGENITQTISNGHTITAGVLQPYSATFTLPVIDLQFFAKRISNTQVQLDWKTIQEIDNKGFYVERKKENEVNFTQLHLVKSAAPNGNASLPLNYEHIDTNNYRGKTYYRLKQEDLDGKFMYSIVRLVNGSNEKIISMKAWPIPSTGPVNILVNGVDKDQLLVFDNNGRQVRQVTINAQTPVQLTGLTPGTYIIKLGSQRELYQKIIVQ